MQQRSRELLSHMIHLLANNKNKAPIMIEGPPGIGKSRDVKEELLKHGFSEEEANLLIIDGYITERSFVEQLDSFLSGENSRRLNFLILDDSNLTSSTKPKVLSLFKSLLNCDIEFLNYNVSGTSFQINIKNLRTIIIYNKSKVNRNIHYQAMESRAFTIHLNPTQDEIIERAKEIFIYDEMSQEMRTQNKAVLKDIVAFVSVHGGPRLDLRLIKQCLDIHTPESNYVENYLYEKLGPKAEIKKSIIESLEDNSLTTMDKKAKSVSQKHGISVRSFYHMKKQISDAINKVL